MKLKEFIEKLNEFKFKYYGRLLVESEVVIMMSPLDHDELICDRNINFYMDCRSDYRKINGHRLFVSSDVEGVIFACAPLRKSNTT